jgi:hypothetical protein
VISVLARAQQDAVRERRRQTPRVRSQLREFYPALRAFPDLTTKTALTVLSAAPTSEQALRLAHDDLQSLARGCGRWGISLREVTPLHDVLHQPSSGRRLWSSRRWVLWFSSWSSACGFST